MSRIDDHRKLTQKEQEQAALEQIVSNRPGSTLLKDERTAHYIQQLRRQERGETAVTRDEITRDVVREEKYGTADWEITKPLPKRPSGALWDGLGRFVQLSDSGLADFRSRYPEFLPAWFYRIPCGNSAERSLKANLMAWQAWRTLVREAWHSSFHPDFVAQLVNIPTTPPGNTRFEVQPVCDAQRAVLAMALESWRARFCPKCGSPFVARKAADKYWPKACFEEQRREKQRASKRKRARRRVAPQSQVRFNKDVRR